MGKLFKKLEKQQELNIIKESLDLNQDIIFSNILEKTKDVNLLEEDFTSYGEYYKIIGGKDPRVKSSSNKDDKATKEYLDKYYDIIERFEAKANAIKNACEERYASLDDRIKNVRKGLPEKAYAEMDAGTIKQHNLKIDSYIQELEREFSAARIQIERLNDYAPDGVRTKSTTELAEIKPNLSRYKRSV